MSHHYRFLYLYSSTRWFSIVIISHHYRWFNSFQHTKNRAFVSGLTGLTAHLHHQNLLLPRQSFQLFEDLGSMKNDLDWSEKAPWETWEKSRISMEHGHWNSGLSHEKWWFNCLRSGTSPCLPLKHDHLWLNMIIFGDLTNSLRSGTSRCLMGNSAINGPYVQAYWKWSLNMGT